MNSPFENGKDRKCDKSSKRLNFGTKRANRWMIHTLQAECNETRKILVRPQVSEYHISFLLDESIIKLLLDSRIVLANGKQIFSDEMKLKIQSWEDSLKRLTKDPSEKNYIEFIQYLNTDSGYELLLGYINLFPLDCELEFLEELYALLQNLKFRDIFTSEIIIDESSPEEYRYDVTAELFKDNLNGYAFLHELESKISYAIMRKKGLES